MWLDGAAGSQVPDVVIDAVSGVYRRGLGNQGAAFRQAEKLELLSLIQTSREHGERDPQEGKRARFGAISWMFWLPES